MFFPDRISSIRPGDKVLEIGPGSTPHPRADHFLEYRFEDPQIALEQRGNVLSAPEFGNRKVSFYEGGRFPFRDNEFDYVIASHVVEHTPRPEEFMAEVFRVGGGRGYLEFPLPPYEYLFDLEVHLTYVWYDKPSRELQYVKKQRAAADEYASITGELRKALELGWDDLVRNNLTYFVQGVEFLSPFKVRQMTSLKAFHQSWENDGNTFARKLVRRVERLFPANRT